MIIGCSWAKMELSGLDLKTLVASSCPKDQMIKGVFSIDLLKGMRLKQDEILLLNTGRSSGPGEHWICVQLVGQNLEVFDSEGLSIDFAILHLSHLGGKYIVYLDERVMPIGARLCGPFVAFFLSNRAYNLDESYKEVIDDTNKSSFKQSVCLFLI